MRMIAIDSSTTRSAIAVIQNGKYKSHSIIDYKNEKNVEERIDKMITSLLFTIQKHKPDFISIEIPKGKPNIELTRKLSEILGAVRGWALMHNVPYYEVMPSQWRSYLSGYEQGNKNREELKQTSIDYVKNNLGLDFGNDDDLCDSICQGLGMVEYLEKFNDDELFE